MAIRKLLVEKYRPTSVEKYIFQDQDTKKLVSKWLKVKEFPNILFTGGPGCGKSTLASILITECGLEPADIKRVNASLTNGIGFIREELEPWMKKAGFGKFKVVLLEEADQLTQQGQKSLRDLIESYSDRIRFIMTANYPKQIIDALHSRFQHIDMKAINRDAIIDMAITIVEEEGIKVAGDGEVLLAHIDAYAPDIRKIINSIDECTGEDNVLGLPRVSSSAKDVGEWIQYCNGSDWFNLKHLLELTDAVDLNNFEVFYEALYQNSSKFTDEGNAIVLISQYLDRAQRAANQRLHLDAFLYHVFMEV